MSYAAGYHQKGPNLAAAVLLPQRTHGDQRVLLLCPRILLGPDAKDSNQAAEDVNKVVVKKKISFDDYKKCVQNGKPTNVKINAIGTLKLTNYSLTQDKLALFGLIKHYQEHTDIGETKKSGKNKKEKTNN